MDSLRNLGWYIVGYGEVVLPPSVYKMMDGGKPMDSKKLTQESLPDYLVKINRLSTEISVDPELLLKASVYLLLRELANKDWEHPCQRCPQLATATWRVITGNGLEYVCTPHHFILDEFKQIKWEEMSNAERARMEAEWNEKDDDPYHWRDGDYWENGEHYLDDLT